MAVQKIDIQKLNKVLMKKEFVFMIVLRMIFIFMNIKIKAIMIDQME